MQVSLEEVLAWVDGVKEEYQREEDQGILQQRLDKASAALSGKEACERLKRRISLRFHFEDNIAVVTQRRKRA